MASNSNRDIMSLIKQIVDQNILSTPNYSLPSPQPQRPSAAEYILTHQIAGPKIAKQSRVNPGARAEEPSFLNNLFDAASGPLFAARSIIEGQVGNVQDFVKDPGLDTAADFFTESAPALAGGLAQSFAAGARIPGTIGSITPDPIVDKIQEFGDKTAPKRYGSDQLEDLGVENNWAKYGGGFVLDVAIDPLTYVPAAGLFSAAKKAKSAQEAITAKAATSNPEVFVKPTTSAPRQQPLGEMVMRSSERPRDLSPGPVAVNSEPSLNPNSPAGAQEVVYNILNDPESMAAMKKQARKDQGWRAAQVRHGRNPDVEEAFRDIIPESPAAFADRMKASKLAKHGKVTDGKGYLSNVSVKNVLDDIAEGRVPAFGPKPSSATGMARDIAIKETDSFLTNNLLPATGRRTIEFDPKHQASLYNRMHDAAERTLRNDPELAGQYFNKAGGLNAAGITAQKELARSMLRSAEDHMIRLGKQPVFWNGSRVRLSDLLQDAGELGEDGIIQAFKNKDLRSVHPLLSRSISTAIARRTHHMSQFMEDLSTNAERAVAEIKNQWTFPQAEHFLKELPEHAVEAGRQAGMTNAELVAVKDLVRNIIDVDKLPIEDFYGSLGKELVDAVKGNRIDPTVASSINRKIADMLGDTAKNNANSISQSKAIDGFMLRMSTWYGRGEMKNFKDDVFNWSEMNAVMRGRLARRMVQNFTYEQRAKGFYIATGRFAGLELDEGSHAAGQIFKDYFEAMLGQSGFNDLKDIENVVAVRSSMLMSDVNRHLKGGGSTFQFTDKANFTTKFGESRNYSKDGDGWFASWREADPKKGGQDPVSFLYDLDLALERTAKEMALYDEFARVFGATPKDAHFDPRIHNTEFAHWRTNGFRFSKEHANQMRRLKYDIDKNIWRPNNKVTQWYSRGLRAWKTGVTIYLPSHHIRNMIGDLHLMWWAGHNDPRAFMWAKRIMHTQRSRYKEVLKSGTFEDMAKLVDRDALNIAKTEGQDIILRKNGVSLTADELYIAAHQHGLLLDANKMEDLFGQAPLENIGKQGTPLNKILSKPLGGKGHQVASNVAEYREHYVRLSHFVAAVNKRLKKSNDMKTIFEEAAHEVRKWHPDGRDMTYFEQSKIRPMIPFYSWTRKALPLVVQAAVTRPSKIMYYPRANYALQGVAGMEPEGVGDPFPDDQMFPEWIRAEGVGPFLDPQSESIVNSFFAKLGRNTVNMRGEETGYVNLNPANPFQDLVATHFGFTGNPLEIGQGILESTTPAIKIPFDLAADEKFSGAPISQRGGGEGVVPYLLEQVPIASAANNVLEIDPLTGQQKELPEGREQGRDIQALINYLTASRLRGTGPYVKSAEFDFKDRLRNQ